MDLVSNLRNVQLFDMYGELLTDKQKQCLEDYLINNFTLSEISYNYGISRQAVNFNIKESLKLLNFYEEKLGLCKKYDTIEEILVKHNVPKTCIETILSTLKE